MENLLHDISWVIPYRDPLLTPIFRGFTWLGYLPFFLIFLSLSFWTWDKDKATRLAVLIALTGLLNAFLKDFWQDPRPPLEFRMDGDVGESYGLPSGHAQIATVMWLWLAYELRRTWAWIAALVIIVGVSSSRIYLGVHDLEDVSAGIALGLINLAMFGWFVSSHFQRWHDLHPAWQVALILGLQPIIYFVWPSETGASFGLALGLFLAGWWIGAKLNLHHFEFERHPEWWVAIVAGVVGVIGVFAFQTGISRALEALELKAHAPYVTTFLIALYMTVLAPLAFRVARIGK